MKAAPTSSIPSPVLGNPFAGLPLHSDLSPSLLRLLFPLLIAFPLLIYVQQSRRPKSTLPPGPPSGFFGTTIPQPYSWRHFENWTREYGDVFTIWNGWTPCIVVGGYKAAMMLLEGDGARHTADRPLSVAGHTLSGGKRILLVEYGERWRKLRKMLHTGLQPSAAKTYEPIQEAAARVFMQDIIAEPDSFQSHASKYAASVIMTVAYGKKTPTLYSDPDVQAVMKCGHRLGMAARPGVWIVDSFPLLRHIPGPFQWRRMGQEAHKEELALFKSQVEKVREAVKDGTAQECFATELIRRQEEFGLNDDEAAYLGGSLFGAGSDTSASAITIAIMAATCFPAAAKAAQEELDRVVGQSRPPTFSDQEDLPYLQAYVKEVFRWRPVSSGGFAHKTTAPLPYKSFIIPKGAIIIGNHWAISRDPSVFPEPDEFRPERWFVDENVKGGQLRKDINHVGYGFGRRVCAGRNVADRSVFINCALLLWGFNFKKKVKDGKEVEIDTLAFTSTANSHPLPFQADIRPRFEGVQGILDEMAQA